MAFEKELLILCQMSLAGPYPKLRDYCYDTSVMNLTIIVHQILLAAISAAKKRIACRWKLLQPLSVRDRPIER